MVAALIQNRLQRLSKHEKVMSKRNAIDWIRKNATRSSHNLVILEAQMSSSSCRNLFCSSFR